MECGLTKVRRRWDQIRSTNSPGGPEVGVANTAAGRAKTDGLKNVLAGSSAEIKSTGAGTALNRASGACLPLQHCCAGAGACGDAGAES